MATGFDVMFCFLVYPTCLGLCVFAEAAFSVETFLRGTATDASHSVDSGVTFLLFLFHVPHNNLHHSIHALNAHFLYCIGKVHE